MALKVLKKAIIIPRIVIPEKMYINSLTSFNSEKPCMRLPAYLRSSRRPADATKPLIIPCRIDRFRKGQIINEAFAPTSCILRIRNRWENMASLMVLLINTATIKRSTTVIPSRMALILVILSFIESIRDSIY